MKPSSTLGGLAGAVALTLLNEGVRRFDKNAPRLDLLGQNAVARLMKGNDLIPQTAQKFFPLAGDLVTNSLFFGMARGTSSGNTLLRGALLGLAAGVGAVALPKQAGLNEAHTAKNTQRSIMTVAWYVIGGLVAAAVINAVDKKHDAHENAELKSGVKNVTKRVAREVAHTI